MTNPVYRGGLVADPMATAQQQAEQANARPEVVDLTAAETEGNPRLTGQTPTAAGSPCAAQVPNLSVTKVGNPCKTKGLPSSLPTSPLSSGRRSR